MRFTDNHILVLSCISLLRTNQNSGCPTSTVCIGKGTLLTCISERLNHSSLSADWTCRWKTLQSLVTWKKELWYLQ
jgi:hypothetical protein